MKLSTYRSLSNLARRVITGCYDGNEKIIDYLNTDEIILYPSDLQFSDILNMASNRVPPQPLDN